MKQPTKEIGRWGLFTGRLGTVERAKVKQFSWDERMPGWPDVRWDEFGMSDCPMGCKAYRNRDTEEVVVMHNSNYNCRR
jgi:hypothetical protein